MNEYNRNCLLRESVERTGLRDREGYKQLRYTGQGLALLSAGLYFKRFYKNNSSLIQFNDRNTVLISEANRYLD